MTVASRPYWPAMLRRSLAASYCDLTVTEFEREVVLYEVENWRLMTHDKEARLAAFWFSWDSVEADWTVRCLAYNRFGRMTHEISLLGFWLDSLLEFVPTTGAVIGGGE